MTGFRLTASRQNVNLWIVPLKMSLAALNLFAITITPDMLAADHVIHLPDWFTPWAASTTGNSRRDDGVREHGISADLFRIGFAGVAW